MDENDLKITILKDPLYNYGGQHVGVPRPNVRVEHIETGITAEVGEHRSLHRNKELAIEMIEWALTSIKWGG